MTSAERTKNATRPVRPLGDARTHYRLALTMSRTVGLDLSAEMAAGRLDQAEWADTVTRCRGCDWASECPSWMAAQEEPVPAPRTCVNADRFDALLRAGEAGQDA